MAELSKTAILNRLVAERDRFAAKVKEADAAIKLIEAMEFNGDEIPPIRRVVETKKPAGTQLELEPLKKSWRSPRLPYVKQLVLDALCESNTPLYSKAIVDYIRKMLKTNAKTSLLQSRIAAVAIKYPDEVTRVLDSKSPKSRYLYLLTPHHSKES